MILYGAVGEGGTTSARYERYFIFHGNLTSFDKQGTVLPRAAVKVPTVQDGDWKVNPDATMEVTWKIRPDAFWHDGTPLTSDDFVFGFEVLREPKLGIATLGETVNMTSVKAIDPKTFAVNWKTTSVQGNVNSSEGVPAIPKHQLGDLFHSGDLVAFEGSPAWRGELIGIGPYRVTKLEQGSHLEAAAFDKYFLGKPKIDRLIMRFVADVNVTVAQLLAGAVDYISRGSSLKPVQMVEIERQLGKDGGTVFPVFNDVRTLNVNFQIADRPWAQDLRVRQALLYGLNRQQLVDVLQEGKTQIAYFNAFPEFPVYKLAEQRGLPKYEYDLNKAQQLLTAAGWTKGTDGILHNSTGQVMPPFYCCRYESGDSNDIRESLAWGTDFKTLGFEVVHPIPAPAAGLSSTETRKAQAQGPRGGSIGNFRVTADQNFGTLITANIPREETRWAGINAGGWANSTYEGLFTKALSTLDVAPRRELEFQMMKIAMEDLPLLPAYYNPSGVAIRKGVEGIGTGSAYNRGNTDDIHLWDIK
ncbi:MAG: peptide ABC transporter substrate-binding protein [Chloroflexi bacterium]|nr:peptide ABC transporter substrate-binding protein [Chloroflexota bacterium]